MKKEIKLGQVPTKYTQEEIIDNVWKRTETDENNKSCTNPYYTNDKEEKILNYTLEIKTFAIAFLILFIGAMLIGFHMKDTTVQDEIDNIQNEKSNISKQEYIIDKATIRKSKSEASIERSKEVLKKYNILYK